MADAQDALVAAVVRLDGKRRELTQDLVAEEGTSSALRTELDAQLATVAQQAATITQQAATITTGTAALDKCRATRTWLTDRVAQLEAAWPSGTTMPTAPTPKP